MGAIFGCDGVLGNRLASDFLVGPAANACRKARQRSPIGLGIERLDSVRFLPLGFAAHREAGAKALPHSCAVASPVRLAERRAGARVTTLKRRDGLTSLMCLITMRFAPHPELSPGPRERTTGRPVAFGVGVASGTVAHQLK